MRCLACLALLILSACHPETEPPDAGPAPPGPRCVLEVEYVAYSQAEDTPTGPSKDRRVRLADSDLVGVRFISSNGELPDKRGGLESLEHVEIELSAAGAAKISALEADIAHETPEISARTLIRMHRERDLDDPVRFAAGFPGPARSLLRGQRTVLQMALIEGSVSLAAQTAARMGCSSPTLGATNPLRATDPDAAPTS